MILTGGRHCRSLLWNEFFVAEDPYGIRSCGHMDTVIDLGAHCGMFSLMTRFLMPKARIIAIEPDPGNYKALVTNIQYLHVETQNIALGDGLPVFLLTRHVRTVSMRYDRLKLDTMGVYDHENQDNPPNSGVAIPSAKLQDLWTQWNPTGRIFVKMDMEGAEHHLLGDAAAENCLEGCTMLAAELHAYPTGPTMKDYKDWIQTRFGPMFDVEITTTHRSRWRAAQLKMRKRTEDKL